MNKLLNFGFSPKHRDLEGRTRCGIFVGGQPCPNVTKPAWCGFCCRHFNKIVRQNLQNWAKVQSLRGAARIKFISTLHAELCRPPKPEESHWTYEGDEDSLAAMTAAQEAANV